MKLIPLISYKYPGLFAKVDDEHYEWLNKYKWHVCKHKSVIYAAYGSKNKTMHRMILGLTEYNLLADHINHDGLDNQHHNLRIATRAQNLYNMKSQEKLSKYKGVHYIESINKKWRGAIKKNGKKQAKAFYTENEAALWYNEKAKILFGEFAFLNIIT